MDEARAADAVVGRFGIRPVIDSGQRGRCVRRYPNADQPFGCAAVLVAADQVEQSGAHPRADDDVGHQRVERVTEPGAAERVLKRARPECRAHKLADCLTGRVEYIGGLNRLDQRLYRRGPAALPVIGHAQCDTRAGTAQPWSSWGSDCGAAGLGAIGDPGEG